MIASANAVAEAWWGWMAAMFWQVGVLIAIVGAVDLLIRRWAWPQVRYGLWLLVLAKLVIPPSVTLPTSLISPVVPWARQQVLGVEDAAGAVAERPAAPPAAARPAPAATGARFPAAAGDVRRGLSWQAVALGVWLFGMGFFVLLLALRFAKLRRWHRAQEERPTIPAWFHDLLVATARRMDLDRLPAIVFSDEAVAPAVYGVFRRSGRARSPRAPAARATPAPRGGCATVDSSRMDTSSETCRARPRSRPRPAGV